MAEEKMDDSLESHIAHDSNNFEFEEDGFMTKFEGYWIQKSRVLLCAGLYHKFQRKAAVSKHLKTDDQKKVKFNRLKKRMLRNEHRLLKLALIKKKFQSEDDRFKSAVAEEGISKKQVHKGKLLKKLAQKGDSSKKQVHNDKLSKELAQEDNSSNKQARKDKLSKKVGQKDDSSKEQVDKDKLSKKLDKKDEFSEKTVDKDIHLKAPTPADYVPMNRFPKVEVTKKPGKYLDIDKNDPNTVLYDGFYIHKSSKDKLDELKEELTQKGLSADDMRKALRMECRKEERLFKKQKKRKVEPSTPVQSKTNLQPRAHQDRTFVHSKPYLASRINVNNPIINTGITPKLHKTFDD